MELFKRILIPRHDTEPYLERTILFRSNWFSILLHRFVGSDDECEHDHPWPFWTFILRGGYWEYVTDSVTGATTKTWFPPGKLLYRPAEWRHRLEIDPKRPPVTIVLHPYKTRRWGFFTRFGWLHHSRYSYRDHCA